MIYIISMTMCVMLMMPLFLLAYSEYKDKCEDNIKRKYKTSKWSIK